MILTAAILSSCCISAAHANGLIDRAAELNTFVSQPPVMPMTDFSPGTCQLTLAGLYGYEKYSMPVPESFPLHRAGFQLAASGAVTENLGWNAATGVSFTAMRSKHVSMVPGSCMVPVSASLAWRFFGGAKPERLNCALFGGASYAYAAVRGYYRRDIPGPPYMFYLIRTVIQADVSGSVYGLFAGIRPLISIKDRISLRPFAAYRIIFDTSQVDYHVRLKILNDELEDSGPVALQYRVHREGKKPIHEILGGIELSVFGAGLQFMVQYSPVINRIFLQTGISYTHSFYAGM